MKNVMNDLRAVGVALTAWSVIIGGCGAVWALAYVGSGLLGGL